MITMIMLMVVLVLVWWWWLWWCVGNIGDSYGATLNAGAAWSVVPAAGGAAIVPSGVTYNSTTGEYALTIASTPATALIVGLAAPSVLTVSPYFVFAITETANKATITTP